MIIIVIIAAVTYFQFTPLGYRMTVPYRSFTEIQKNVYIENNYSGDTDEVKSLVDEARNRVIEFWGNVESTPTVIISSNIKTLAKLGGNHDTATAIIFGAYSYISISDEYLNVDVLAHEMTHAELHKRLYKGKLPQTLIPIWFDEGVATQNDYREQYSDKTWYERTNNGSDTIELDDMDTATEFYAGNSDDRRFRYLISSHEVKEWIEKNGM
ncbi:MAG: hypothetical protein K2N36_06920, partial [Ruminiclostridium sp.]|nr:hypothetical protein [Ruminiclostridium sp.]